MATEVVKDNVKYTSVLFSTATQITQAVSGSSALGTVADCI